MLVALVMLLVTPTAVLAVNTGLEATRAAADLPQTTIDAGIGGIISAAMGLVGVLFLVLMIYGGFLWMTAAGNEKRVESAKSIMVSAVIGLAIVFGAYAITELVFSTIAPSTSTGGTSPQEACVASGGTWAPPTPEGPGLCF